MASARTWALVGSESLMGREVRDLVATGRLPVDLKLIADTSETAGTLTVQDDEPALVQALEGQTLREAGVVFLAGSPESTLRALDAGGDAIMIDLTHAAEDHPRSFIRAPFVEGPGFRAPEDAVHSIAHPMAIAIAMVLEPLHAQFPIRRSVIQIFEPASERGTPGVEELQQQTVSLLSFKSMPKKIFDQQLAFNMLARYGEEAAFSLESAELRIERHLATLLSRATGTGGNPPMPSLRLIQAPVFHGYNASLWVEFVENPGVEAVESALEGEHIDVRKSDLDPPTSVGTAGQDGVAIGALVMDRNAPQACWCWLVADNLRLSAENAVAVGRQFS
ncbi:MAG TPA: Asd/ArgC dimerization domain-containing protein [Bryobacteraceae bacterium]|nr:Asd/ArgC dimerization domain-containing protein [Bryobacteraceae bacterium]